LHDGEGDRDRVEAAAGPRPRVPNKDPRPIATR
jgi:hypothetical protein